jgi:hypothetical protein
VEVLRIKVELSHALLLRKIDNRHYQKQFREQIAALGGVGTTFINGLNVKLSFFELGANNFIFPPLPSPSVEA